jgi:hypothetical protein
MTSKKPKKPVISSAEQELPKLSSEESGLFWEAFNAFWHWKEDPEEVEPIILVYDSGKRHVSQLLLSDVLERFRDSKVTAGIVTWSEVGEHKPREVTCGELAQAFIRNIEVLREAAHL